MENKNNNSSNNNNGVRKGAWTKEEDSLLRDCIHTYGEGKWHLVPLRAGLRRCRKSCRLRWLNYLRPNLKRGFFNKDEVDLIVRLHKLLGNRWSLIAGRLPGRTANDVKNFWNSHISKRPPLPPPPAVAAGETPRRKAITQSNIIRPLPRTFSTSQPPAWSAALVRSNSSPPPPPPPPAAAPPTPANNEPSGSSLQEDLDECLRWWGDLLEMAGSDEVNPFLFSGEEAAAGGEGLRMCGDGMALDGDMDWSFNSCIDHYIIRSK